MKALLDSLQHVKDYTDIECDTMFDAMAKAELFTSLGFEVTKPLDVDGVFCFRVSRIVKFHFGHEQKMFNPEIIC